MLGVFYFGQNEISLLWSHKLMQGIMPIIGFYFSELFVGYLGSSLKWFAFGIILFLGVKMLYEGIHKAISLRKYSLEDVSEENMKTIESTTSFSFTKISIQSVATSLDALMVGATLRLVTDIHIATCGVIIAIITFGTCLAGSFLGLKVGNMIRKRTFITEMLGGSALILLSITFIL